MPASGGGGPRSRSRFLLAGLLLLAVLLPGVGLLAVQVLLAARGENLPDQVGFVVDLTVHPAGRAAAATAPPWELVMLGDSTVAGIGSPTVEESLPALVAQRVADATGRSVHVLGYGVSGARTDQVRTGQVPRLDDAADAVVVVVGSNDVTHLTPVWQMERRTGDLLAAARERTGAPLVLGGIPQFRTVPRLPQPLRAVTGVYASALREPQRAAATAAGPDVIYVDIAAEASPRFLGRPESMAADGYHPSPIGYGFWADALAPAVVAALPATAPEPEGTR